MDVQLDGQSLTTASATTAPAAGTVEAWTVSTLAAGIPTLVDGQTYALVDATPGASASQQAEIIRVTVLSAGSTALTATRGVEGTTPVAHAASSIFNIVAVSSFLNGASRVLAQAENAGGTVTSIAGNLVYTAIPGCNVVVLPCPYDVYLEFEISAQITTAALGAIYAAIKETTSGTPVLLCVANRSVQGDMSGTGSAVAGTMIKRRRIGPVASTRTFQLYGVSLEDSGVTTLAWNVNNAATAESYLRAVI